MKLKRFWIVIIALVFVVGLVTGCCFASSPTPTRRPTPTPSYNFKLGGASMVPHFEGPPVCDKLKYREVSRDAPFAKSIAKTGQSMSCDGKMLIAFTAESDPMDYWTYWTEERYILPK